MLRTVSIVLVAAAACVWSDGKLFAQAQGFGGSALSSGGGGMQSGGSSFGSSGSSFGGTSSGTTGGSLGNTGTGLSMMNAANLSGGFGMLGFGALNGFTTGGASSMYGGRTYGSTTTAGGTSTSGSTAGGNRSTGSSTSSTAGRGGSTAGSTSRGRRSTSTAGTTPKQQPVWFEPRIEVGFDVPPPKTSVVVSDVATAIGVANPGSRFAGVRVAVDGQTAILRGMVASQNDRQLAEQITLLEPSIVSVRNELIVQRPSTAPADSR